MPSLADALYRGVTGGRSPGTEPKTLQGRMALLEQHYGSVTAAARAVGVDRRTWQRWRTGQHPRPETLHKVIQAVRQTRVPAGREARIRAGQPRLRHKHRREGRKMGPGPGLTITGTYTVSADTRRRTVNFSRDVDPEVYDRMMDNFMSGDDQGAADTLMEALNERIPGLTLEEVDSIEF